MPWVFETLESDGKEVARHTDLNDAAQTVSVTGKTPATPATPTSSNPKTGDDRNPVLWIALLCLSIAGIAIVVISVVRKRKQTRRRRNQWNSKPSWR